MGERDGKRVRIILIGNFHYSGFIISEDDMFITINDKFGKEVSIRKDRIEMMEVENGN